LRAELLARGTVFHSRSDTEVLLAGYAEAGTAFLPRLRGMFAFTLWDERRSELVLARDPLGIKPLYYTYDGEQLVFASELRALLRSGAVSRRLDPAALAGYLSFGSVPEPRTLVADAQLLLPGHLLRVKVHGDRVAPPEDASFSEANWTPGPQAAPL